MRNENDPCYEPSDCLRSQNKRRRRGGCVLLPLADADPQGIARNWRANGPDGDDSGKAFPFVVGTETVEGVRKVTGRLQNAAY